MNESMEAAVCSLSDPNIVSLFVYISEKIDFSKVKRLVFANTSIGDPSFVEDAVIALNSFFSLQTVSRKWTKPDEC